ncbi:protein MODIFIER OF SNC1 1-like [Silene latifolia]|uniref:protein MODIFIER OF SNC1 1-like n=1 Tax=Silene latifolia TaxID=37657 RepID=UPI003D76FA87
MTSSMGEQRWASKRRGGMTVLGKVAKVAVPKPLNLPSQKLENHGLDPNVEIVPKGTLSWGSRPSSGSSNAWATSALSPSTDGGSSSPSHLAGRPLSGGGTRPSTAGSEKGHDSNVIAWGPNSRPSSASGVQGSNLASSTSLRPHSADTRPGSAQLSRFADHSLEGSAARGATVSSEQMGGNEGFSLSSGDFPTLGTDKDESRMKMESLDASHGRPGSSSGGAKSMPDSMEISHEDASDSGIRDYSWRKNSPPFVEDGPRPSMERWHGDPHLYQNPNIGPPHYDSWRGAPSANPPPGGVWYRGPHGPPPYGGPVPPRGFHMEPFPYYHSQNPAPGLANSQPIPPGVGHHGHHPQNGDMYRPHLQESFMRPGLPMRPGFYPGPVPFEGYYRPQMGFCHPNERDLPFMGMPAGPISNRPTNQNAPDLNNSHPRSFEGRRPDQVDPDRLHDPRGNYKVLVNQNDGEYQSNKERWGHRVISDVSNREKGILSKAPLQETAWGDDYQKHDNSGYGKNAVKDEVPSRPPDNRYHSSNSANPKLSESVFNAEKSGTRPGSGDRPTSRDHSLIQKIEGLNAKARSSGGNVFNGEEPTERVQMVDARPRQSLHEADTGVVLGRHYPTGVRVPVSRDTDLSASEKSGESMMAAGPRRANQGGQNRGYSHGRENSEGQEVSRWGRRSQSHSVQSAGSNLTNDHVEDMGLPRANIEMKGDAEPAMSSLDSGDTQRAKMREIAKQRAIQLQKEEEERIREQKAKALAKLEELNRRSATHVPQAPSQKQIGQTCSAVPLMPDDSKDQSDLKANSIARPNSGVSDETAPTDIKVMDPAVKVEDAPSDRTAAQVDEVSKHKRAGYKSKQNVHEKNLTQKLTGVGQDVSDHNSGNAIHEVTVGNKVDGGSRKELPEIPHVSDSSAPQKRRNNKSGKNKPKVETSSNANPSTVSQQNNSDLGRASSASMEDNTSDLRAYSKQPAQPPGSHSSDVHGRVNNAWKGQHSRNVRSSQGNKLSEKAQSNDAVVWAPVCSVNKVEVPAQTTQKAVEPVALPAAGESMPQSSFKSKRAEMERYVPKPGVAKELAQQGSIQQYPSLPVDQSTIAQASIDFSVGNGGREKDSQGFDNRHGRGQGSWRQRVSAESNHAHESMTTDPPNRPAELPMKGPEAITSDGQSGVNDSTSKSSAAFTSAKGQFPSGRGKRHPFKGQKSSGNSQSFEHKDSNAGLNDSHIGSERNHIEKTQSSKESRAVVDRSAAHWQPKSQVHVAHNQLESSKPDIGSGSIVHSHLEHNLFAAKDRRPGSEEKSMQDFGHKEKRDPHAKGQPHPSNQALESEIEDRRNEQRPLSGYRKNSNYGSRVNRVHESRGEWTTTAPESKQHYSSANRERQRQNSHYEYQAVAPSHESNDREPQIQSQQGGQRFRERGPSRRGRGGRGNFYGRQSGNE